MNLKMIKRNIIYLLILFFLFSCTKEELPLIPEEPSIPGKPSIPNNEKTDMKITINNLSFKVILEENSTVEEFKKLMPLKIEMDELNGNEKYYYLDTNLVTNSESVKRINSGDLMLYGSNCLVLFYEDFETSYNYTRIGKVENNSNLASSLGKDSVFIQFILN